MIEPTGGTHLPSILLEEYKSLRQEIIFRATSQAAILSLNVTAIGAIAGLFFSSQIGDARIFFLIPLICSILGLMYTDHALNIGKLAKFIRWQVKPRLAEAAGLSELVDYEVFSENYTPPNPAYRHVLPVAIIAMFIAIPIAAIALPFTDLLGAGRAVQPSIQNLALVAPGIVLLVWFLIVYYSVHYGGTPEKPLSSSSTVGANDYRT
jgi:cation transporter-like permease